MEPDDVSIGKSEILELEAWKEIVTSDNWKHFKTLLATHKAFLNKQALLSVDGQDQAMAYAYRVRAKECDAILNLVSQRLDQLKQGNKESDDE